MNISEPYARDEFLSFLTGFLPDFQPNRSVVVVPTAAKTIRAGEYLGRSAALDLDVFEFEHEGGQDKRISLTTDGFRVMKEHATFQALAIFRSRDTDQWRLSLMTASPEVDTTGKIITRLSNPKRYSFLLGPGAKVNTPTRFLIGKGKVATLDELKERFSIEVVNKDFYRQIATFFNRLTGGDVKIGSKKQHFEPELVLPNSAASKTAAQEFSVRLIGRIIFSWFLKQKKSDAGTPLLPEEHLSAKAIQANPGYYHMVLEKMFFEAMNKPVAARRRDLPEAFDQIPFLNGGLFDPHVDDYYSDGQFNGALKVPDEWFKDLFEVLETYNFTIDENTVLDVDLSIDPEMLGRIFENLLAEINPDTGESARKSTGSYYTPRQIVEYMVDQSLIQYLVTKTGIEEKKIEALASVNELDDEDYPLSDDEKSRIVDALDEVKIIDPACGSGAFPIGILQKIVFMLGRVDPQGQLWFAKKTEGLDPLLQEDFKKKFENENFDYIRKTGIIRDSIYGVDLQPIAVEVSKLRCFLTLIVDEDIDDTAENRGIKPLPNLEFKFVAANTLIKLPGSLKQAGSTQQALFEEQSEIEQLKKIRDRYFVSTGYEKMELRSKFKDIQRAIFKNQISKSGHGQMSMALADWDPFSNLTSTWFDPDWMFGVQGFDIAIANPPYITIGGKQDSSIDESFRQYFKKHYESYSYKANIFNLFLERSVGLLTKCGIITYIVPRTILDNHKMFEIRSLLLDQMSLLFLVHHNYRVFEHAETGGNLVLIASALKQVLKTNSVKTASLNKYTPASQITYDLIPQEVFEKNTEKKYSFFNNDNLNLMEKICTHSVTLESVAEIKNGVNTGNAANVLLSHHKDSPNHRRILEGKNINRYSVIWRDLWINYDPTLKTKLDLSSLKTRQSKIDFALREARIFLNPKIIIRQTAETIIAAIDQDGYITRHSTHLIIPNENTNIKVLLAILNSNVIDYYYRSLIPETGKVFPEVKIANIKKLPIRRVDDPLIINEIEKIVDRIIFDKKQNMETEELESQINILLYGIYDLTPEDVKVIEDAHLTSF
jgi:adenine-specific DNA-methyltransferase